jgi:hypothetical protein
MSDLQDKNLVKEIINSKSYDFMNRQDEYMFLRRGAHADLDGGVPPAVEVAQILAGDNPYKLARENVVKTFLYPNVYESPLSFQRRLAKAKCPGFAKTVLLAMLGFFMKPDHDLDMTSGSQILFERFKTNIGNNLTFKSSVKESTKELFTMGQLYLYTDFMAAMEPSDFDENRTLQQTKNATFPLTQIIPVEQVQNVAFDEEGRMQLLIFHVFSQRQEDFQIIDTHQINAINNERLVTIESEHIQENSGLQLQDSNWKVKLNTENKLKQIPCSYKEIDSIVEIPATYDVCYMNRKSIVDSILDASMLAMLYAPASAVTKDKWPHKKGHPLIGSDVLIKLEQDDPSPGFVSPSNSVSQAHLDALENDKKLAFRLQFMRESLGAPESGESKKEDFRGIEAFLNNARDEITSAYKETAQFWADYTGNEMNVNYKIGNFNIRSAKEALDIIEQVYSMNPGEDGSIDLLFNAFKLANPDAPNELLEVIKNQITEKEKRRAKLLSKNPESAFDDNIEINQDKEKVND